MRRWRKRLLLLYLGCRLGGLAGNGQLSLRHAPDYLSLGAQLVQPTPTRPLVRTCLHVCKLNASSHPSPSMQANNRTPPPFPSSQTSKLFVRELSMVPVYALLLFGGDISVDRDRGLLRLDGWAEFKVSGAAGVCAHLPCVLRRHGGKESPWVASVAAAQASEAYVGYLTG